MTRLISRMTIPAALFLLMAACIVVAAAGFRMAPEPDPFTFGHLVKYAALGAIVLGLVLDWLRRRRNGPK